MLYGKVVLCTNHGTIRSCTIYLQVIIESMRRRYTLGTMAMEEDPHHIAVPQMIKHSPVVHPCL
jgi:hypothetical protein